jgi:uncharacterized LabA/DUF88 family protein
MGLVVYAYIDGAHLLDRSSAAIRQLWDADPDLDFNNIRDFLGAGRLFYYDCLEDEPRPNETPEQFEARTVLRRSTFSKVLDADMCHVRMGTLKGKRITQKEVDVRIAVDMLTHASTNKISRAVLLSGDLDFRPVVESLVQIGVTVELCFDPSRTAIELREAADIRRPILFRDWHRLCSVEFQARYCLPEEWRGDAHRDAVDALQIVRKGHVGGNPVAAWIGGRKNFTVQIETGDPRSMPFCLKHPDLNFLTDRFLPLAHPGIEWEPNLIGVG